MADEGKLIGLFRASEGEDFHSFQFWRFGGDGLVVTLGKCYARARLLVFAEV